MLEAKNLTKIYKPKHGVPVTALDHISIKFPKTGMVFLLGKSGSGKSTLLNVLGGLDRLDGGEIIIKGKSSEKFKQQHFDSYRNTYVGFIFQEYNVLDEFTVGGNIALALELQGKKATDERINEILNEVDLNGFGSRKPNELSGGQKQRVAIARALVKNPEIIMADEPTGALDSVTGRQVFDTLKKLSRNKLVIVVSHDREFAEQYADRIIELSDGKIISDMEISSDSHDASEQGLSFSGTVISVPCDYRLTEEDRLQINNYLSALSDNLSLQITENPQKKTRFQPTDESKIKFSDSESFQLIQSKLSLKSAFKIGAGGLKYKKFRLCLTVFLSVISFFLFGLSDTFGAYNHVKSCTNSILDSKINYVSVNKAVKRKENVNIYWDNYNCRLTDEDLKSFANKTGVSLQGVYLPKQADLYADSQLNPEISLSETDYEVYLPSFSGFSEIDREIIGNMGFRILAGELPNGDKNEIAVSEYIYEVFKKGEYRDPLSQNGFQKIDSPNDFIGKKLYFLQNGESVAYTVTAVIDTHFDLKRYLPLTEKKKNQDTADKLLDYALYEEFMSAFNGSFAGIAMVGNGFIERISAFESSSKPISGGNIYFFGNSLYIDPFFISSLQDVKKKNIVWVNGEKNTLDEKEIIVSTDLLMQYNNESDSDTTDYIAMIKKETNLKRMGSLGNQFNISEDGYQIVGILPADENSNDSQTVVMSDSLFQAYSEHSSGLYGKAVGLMPREKSAVEKLVSYCYRETENVRYPLQNSVTYELDTVHSVLKTLSDVFLYIGIGFAVFAALMLANFIGTSISYKKQEIGILRAIGSRGNDVFRIFFAESFIIAIVNFILSAIGVFVATVIINQTIRTKLNVLVTVLNFGARQILLLLLLSVLIAFVSSYIPVKKIASKRPIDAIRDR